MDSNKDQEQNLESMDCVISELLDELRRESSSNQSLVREWLLDKVGSVFGPFCKCRKLAPRHLKRDEAIQLLLHELREETKATSAVLGCYMPYLTKKEKANAIVAKSAMSARWKSAREWLTGKLEKALNEK